MTHRGPKGRFEGFHPAARSGAGDHGRCADSRCRGRAAGGRRLGPSRPAGAGRLGRRLPARGRGEPPGARSCRPRGRPADRSTSRARAEGAAGRARHAGLRQPSRGRHRASLLARPGTVGGGATGAQVAALATSPIPVTPVPTEGDRYTRMLEAFGLTAREMLTCGCHVHVSVADDDEGVAVLNRIRIWLPVLTALAANSPFWQGEDTGYASFRSQAWHRWP